MAFSWSEYQTAVFSFLETTKQNLVIEAVAGSGKSTTILEAAMRVAGSVGIIAFNKAIAVELEGKITSRLMTQAQAKTFHSAGNGAINSYLKGNGKKRAEIDDKKVNKIVDEICVKRPDIAEFGSFIEAAVKMAKNLAIGAPGGPAMGDMNAWNHMIYFYGIDEKLPDNVEGRLEDKAIPAAIHVLKKSNADITTIDFSDMVYLPLVHNMRVWGYDNLMVDEAQDLNLSRMLLAKKMIRRGGRFIFVGDPRQNIYGFTGAMHDALEIIKREFRCHTLPLSVTYRSAKKIVAYAHRVVSHIQAAPNAPEGEVLFIGGDEFNATQLLPTDAILCRVNAPMVTLAFSLIRRGIACKIEGREIGAGLVALVGKWKVKSLDALRNKLEAYRDKEVAKALAKDQEERADAIMDKVSTLMVLIERQQADADIGNRTVAGLKDTIESMFADDVTKSGLLTLCSYHRSKGREWPTVYRLDHAKHCPSRFARQEHQLIAEHNLDYVATTRAMTKLVEVDQGAETLPKQEKAAEKVAA